MLMYSLSVYNPMQVERATCKLSTETKIQTRAPMGVCAVYMCLSPKFKEFPYVLTQFIIYTKLFIFPHDHGIPINIKVLM